MSLFGGDNELGNILQEAVKLKSAQMGQKRKTYETWPFFVQHTLFHGEKEDLKAWRQLPFDEKIVICERLKEEGNELFKKGSWSDAVEKYEEAPTLVHYCWSSDPGWRKNNRGIDDDVLHLVEDKGSTEEDAKRQIKLRATCALNIAACKQKLSKLDEAIVACDAVLELDPDNVKALYRRAESRIRPVKATAYDHDLAIKDLAQALRLDPSNQPVEKLLTRLRAERKVQREKDSKTFNGMFDRGQIYDKEGSQGSTFPVKEGESLDEVQARIDAISDEDSLEKRTQDAELLRDLYMRNGKEEEAKQLHEQIKDAKKAAKNRENPPKMDWDNPTPEMIEDARKHDLDITDPLVIQELKRLEREGLDSMPPNLAEDGAGTSSSSSARACSPEEEDAEDDGEEIPWLRYVIFFAIVFVIWQLFDFGMSRWLVAAAAGKQRQKTVTAAPTSQPPEAFGEGSVPDEEVHEPDEVVVTATKSMFSAAYDRMVYLFVGDGDETEL
eukprot:TRINITY_DN88128_c0_g1_i1.p1 TRINITY_DN88128_c0_g1~~TRINITY_DN88128_c0_g1_i1.p1  ORF type:complete len:525 (-),score=144.24 TRINITY_DN88128_c0_g1_i1:30-1523(-)